MKARVKGTTAIIDVTFDKDALNAGYPPYKASGGIYYYPEQLVWIDNIDSVEPDYWTKLKHLYAGIVMQGLVTNPKLCEIETANSLASTAYTIATTLIDKLKEDEQNKETQANRR